MRSVITLICLVSLAPAVVAEDSPMPRLGDHTFVPVTAIAEPFITTHVQTAISLGSTVNSKTPVYSLTDSTIIAATSSDQTFAGIGFTYQQGVQDWLAAWFSLAAAGRVGTSTQTLVSDGITGTLGYSFGWKMRIHQARTMLVTGSVGLGNQNATFINLLDWAYGLLEGEEIPLVRPRNSLHGAGGVHAAWGINHRFGLLGTVILSYGESFDGVGGNSWFNDVRLAVSYNGEQDLNVPIGLAVTGGYYNNRADTDSDKGVWFWSARIANQSKSDFTIGLDLTTSYYNTAKDAAARQFIQATIDMRYFY